MHRLAAIFLGSVFFLVLGSQTGCSSKQADPMLLPPEDQKAESPEQVIWNLYPKGLTLNLNTDKDLNTYENWPNSVMVCVYQLNNSASFQALIAVEDGLETLLACTKFDTTVVSASRIFVQPEAKIQKISDRLEGAKALGLVVGYMAPASAESTVCRVDFPLRKTMAGMPFFKHAEYTPNPLTLDIKLGLNSVTCKSRTPGTPDPYPAPPQPTVEPASPATKTDTADGESVGKL